MTFLTALYDTAIKIESTTFSTIGAHPQQAIPGVGAMLSEGKKPCDEDKKKAEAEAKKDEQALQNLLGDSADKMPAEPEQKSLGAVPTMGNCK